MLAWNPVMAHPHFTPIFGRNLVIFTPIWASKPLGIHWNLAIFIPILALGGMSVHEPSNSHPNWTSAQQCLFDPMYILNTAYPIQIIKQTPMKEYPNEHLTCSI